MDRLSTAINWIASLTKRVTENRVARAVYVINALAMLYTGFVTIVAPPSSFIATIGMTLTGAFALLMLVGGALAFLGNMSGSWAAERAGTAAFIFGLLIYLTLLVYLQVEGGTMIGVTAPDGSLTLLPGNRGTSTGIALVALLLSISRYLQIRIYDHAPTILDAEVASMEAARAIGMR